MAVTASEIAAFHDFALQTLEVESPDSLESLVDAWRLLNPTLHEHAENVAAIRAALRDMEAGDVGRPATHVVHELRLELASATKKWLTNNLVDSSRSTIGELTITSK